MRLTGLHLLLSYRCTLACDHCFVWGSPRQRGSLSLADIRLVLRQAGELGTIDSIYFEGGEPFLFYATLLQAAREAASQGYSLGIVTNAYWAASPEKALELLRPFQGLIQDLTVSSDLYHWRQPLSRQSQNAARAAEALGIPTGLISIARPEKEAPGAEGQLPYGEGKVMYRGRAAVKLSQNVPPQPWEQFNTCTHEDLVEPGRIHVDPLGNLHICQGISIGNLFQTPLKDLCAQYDPQAHPIVGPILRGGPAELVRAYALPHADGYADACHLCYTARQQLRQRFPEELGPDAMYGIF